VQRAEGFGDIGLQAEVSVARDVADAVAEVDDGIDPGLSGEPSLVMWSAPWWISATTARRSAAISGRPR
jgi:hypothetical protein